MGNFVGVLMTGSFVIHNRRMTFIRIIFNCFTANRKDTNLVKMPMDLNGHLSILQLSCFYRKRSNYYPYRYVHFQVGFNMHGLDKNTKMCIWFGWQIWKAFRIFHNTWSNSKKGGGGGYMYLHVSWLAKTLRRRLHVISLKGFFDRYTTYDGWQKKMNI